jgi:hypothetical protein
MLRRKGAAQEAGGRPPVVLAQGFRPLGFRIRTTHAAWAAPATAPPVELVGRAESQGAVAWQKKCMQEAGRRATTPQSYMYHR